MSLINVIIISTLNQDFANLLIVYVAYPIPSLSLSLTLRTVPCCGEIVCNILCVRAPPERRCRTATEVSRAQGIGSDMHHSKYGFECLRISPVKEGLWWAKCISCDFPGDEKEWAEFEINFTSLPASINRTSLDLDQNLYLVCRLKDVIWISHQIYLII